MAHERARHVAALVGGKVLVAGGEKTLQEKLSSAELYDPVANTWSPAGDLSLARSDSSITPLASGSLLVAGGSVYNADSSAVVDRFHVPCDGSILTDENDHKTDCAPYRCSSETESCRTSCATIDDCAPPNTCDADHRCKPAAAASTSAPGASDSSCNLGPSGGEGGALLIALAWMLGRARRSRRAGARATPEARATLGGAHQRGRAHASGALRSEEPHHRR
jgi:hypothetical protein